MIVRPTTIARASALAVAALVLAACGSGDSADNPNDAVEVGSDQVQDGGSAELSGDIVIDGSSTVTPLVEPAAELFMNENSGVRVSVATSGTGGGFEKFCNGETDISMASRPISDEEIEACAANGIEYDEVNVANDGLALVVHPDNDWAVCLTVDEVSAAWTRDSAVSMWSEINPAFPDTETEFFGPGSDSGTFDFFTEEVNGESGVIRTDYNNIGEDDNAAVIGVSGNIGAMAFIPLSYVIEAGDQVKTVQIENEAGECFAPSNESVMSGDYNPLGRQLYVYPSAAALAKPETVAFLEFFINNGDEIAEAATMIPLTAEQKEESLAKVAELASR